MEAQFDTHCRACNVPIDEGDEIAMDDDHGWVHADCAGTAPAGRPAAPGAIDALDSLMGGTPLGSGDLSERAATRRAAAGYATAAGAIAGEPTAKGHAEGCLDVDRLVRHRPDTEVPPTEPAPQVEYKSTDRYDRYVLSHPNREGKTVTLSRCTTVVKAGEDTYNLDVWQKGNVAVGLARRPDLLAMAATMKSGDKSLKNLVKEAETAGGGDVKANLGTALHGFTEMVDWGRPLSDVPEAHRPDITAYMRARILKGLDVVPCAIERITMTSRWDGIAGKFDRIYRMSDGSYVIGDVKSGGIEYGRMKIFAQLAVYAQGANEVGVYDVANGCWERLPFEVRTDIALIVHLPAGTGTCEIYTADLGAGRDHVEFCAGVRRQRKLKPGLPVYPAVAPEVRDWSRAIRDSRTRDELAVVGRLMTDREALTPELRALAMRHRSTLPE